MDVADWLRTLGFERYEAAFRENDVDAELLLGLTDNDLKDIGVNSLGHRRRLLEAIAALRHGGTPAGNSVRSPSAGQPDPRPRRDHRRTPPANRDVLRPGGFDGAE